MVPWFLKVRNEFHTVVEHSWSEFDPLKPTVSWSDLQFPILFLFPLSDKFFEVEIGVLHDPILLETAKHLIEDSLQGEHLFFNGEDIGEILANINKGIHHMVFKQILDQLFLDIDILARNH